MGVESDSDLIRAVLDEASPAAYAGLVRRYERLVWTVAWSVLRDYHATQDVTQETFLIAHKRLRGLRNPDSIGAWLSSIARREAQRVRSMRKESDVALLSDIADGATPPIPSEEYQSLLTAISVLPNHERDVTAMRYLNGHSVAEIAQLLDRPIGTVTKQLSRAVKRLQSELQGEASSTIPNR